MAIRSLSHTHRSASAILRLFATVLILTLIRPSACRPRMPDIALSDQGDNEGASAEVSDLQLLEDRLGSEMEFSAHLPVKKYQVLHASDSGKLSRAFRNVASKRKCANSFDGGRGAKLCAVTPDGYSSVGFVKFDFHNPMGNLKGESYQTQISCRCLTKACNVSIAAMPAEIVDPNKPNEEPLHRCLYIRRKGTDRLARCITALLNFTRVPRYELPDVFPLMNASKAFTFVVNTSQIYWKAEGTRGATYTVSKDYWDDLEFAPFQNRTMIDTSIGPSNKDMVISWEDYELVRSDEPEENDPCVMTRKFASLAGAWNGGQIDPHAIGLKHEDLSVEKPEILRKTELYFIFAASLLAHGTTFKILHNHHDRNQSLRADVYILLVSLAVFFVEGIVLYVMYGQTLTAYMWQGEFYALDGALAVHKSSDMLEWDATDSMMILNALIGTATYLHVYHSLMIVLVFISSVMILASFVYYVRARIRFHRGKPLQQSSFAKFVTLKSARTTPVHIDLRDLEVLEQG